MLKLYWKETLAVIAVTAVLGIVVDIGADFLVPSGLAEGGMLSAGVMAVALVAMVAIFAVPVICGAMGGYLISKKTKELMPALMLPAAGAAIGGILMLAVSGVFLLVLDDAGWQAQLDTAKEAVGEGMNIFAEMGTGGFKSFVLFSLAVGAVFMAAINFAFGLAGSFLGRWLSLRSS